MSYLTREGLFTPGMITIKIL